MAFMINCTEGQLKWVGEGLYPEIMEGIFDRYNSGLKLPAPKIVDWTAPYIGDLILSSSDDNTDRFVPVLLSRDPVLDHIMNSKHPELQIRYIVLFIARLSHSNNHIGKQLVGSFNVTPFELLMEGWYWYRSTSPVNQRGISQEQILDAIDKMCKPGAESSANRVKAISRIILDRDCCEEDNLEVLKAAIYGMTLEECASFQDVFIFYSSGDSVFSSFVRMRKLGVPVVAFSWCKESYLAGDAVECLKVISSVKKLIVESGIPVGVASLVLMFV